MCVPRLVEEAQSPGLLLFKQEHLWWSEINWKWVLWFVFWLNVLKRSMLALLELMQLQSWTSKPMLEKEFFIFWGNILVFCLPRKKHQYICSCNGIPRFSQFLRGKKTFHPDVISRLEQRSSRSWKRIYTWVGRRRFRCLSHSSKDCTRGVCSPKTCFS